MIELKSDREINYMRDAGRVVAQTHQEVAKAIRPGVSTKELDQIAEESLYRVGRFRPSRDMVVSLHRSVLRAIR